MKKLWKENRVLLMLFAILLACLIAIVCVCVTFFYNRNTSEYGPRLDGIENYPITEKFMDSYENKVLENENVDSVKFTVKGRMVYIHITYNDGVLLDVAKGVATESLALFEEDILGFYDINFVLKSDSFTILGAKTSKIDFVSWNNNTPIPEDGEEE